MKGPVSHECKANLVYFDIYSVLQLYSQGIRLSCPQAESSGVPLRVKAGWRTVGLSDI